MSMQPMRKYRTRMDTRRGEREERKEVNAKREERGEGGGATLWNRKILRT